MLPSDQNGVNDHGAETPPPDPAAQHRRRRKADIESCPDKPAYLSVNPDGLPDELKSLEQWVHWRGRWRAGKGGDGGKWSKVPRHCGRAASSTDPGTWMTFAAALDSLDQGRQPLDGIGFVFSPDDPYCGVDLDDCRDPDTGEIDAWAAAIVATLDSYTEVSPTGTGLKVWVRGQKPPGDCKRKYETGEVEIYDRGRYFAATGRRLGGTPHTVNDRQRQLDALHLRVFGEPSAGKEGSPEPGPSGGRTKFKPVSRDRPCQVCGKASKCSRGTDGLIMCGRPPDHLREGDRYEGLVYLGRARNDAQWGLFRRADDPKILERERERRVEPGESPFIMRATGGPSSNGRAGGQRPDMAARARELAANLTDARRAELAWELGLPECVIAALPLVGWSDAGFHDGYGERPCWTFAEFDAAGDVVGISCRYGDGSKRSMPGGRRGLVFSPAWRELALAGEPLFLPEGASDTLAVAALGFPAVGRPSNTGGVEALVQVLTALPSSTPVVVLAEYDPKPDGTWPGRDGACQVAGELAGRLGREVSWALPPGGTKDVRAWVRSMPTPSCADGWEALGRAWLGGLQRVPARVPAAGSFVWRPITAAEFAHNDYRPTWLVRQLLVRGQPVIVGGPKKALKTSLLIDLAVSLASGHDFLGHFSVDRAMRVSLLCGESGEFTVHETAERVCAARGFPLDELDDALILQFDLPQLANASHMAVLRAGLVKDRIDVVIIDPLYLALLAGLAPGAVRAENLFDMGPLMARVTRTCLDVGATPIFAHHARKGAGGDRDPLGLDDLSFSGIAEFARQWLLVSPREPYEPGTGSHKLWLSAGGSAGHGGLWSVDVEEGVPGEDFEGRTWEVTVTTGGEQRRQAREGREEERAGKEREQDEQDDDKLLAALDRLSEGGAAVLFRQVRVESRLSDARATRAADRLVRGGVLEHCEVPVKIGNHASRDFPGLRRKPGEPRQRDLPTGG
jgi:hypothetical protein